MEWSHFYTQACAFVVLVVVCSRFFVFRRIDSKIRFSQLICEMELSVSSDRCVFFVHRSRMDRRRNERRYGWERANVGSTVLCCPVRRCDWVVAELERVSCSRRTCSVPHLPSDQGLPGAKVPCVFRLPEVGLSRRCNDNRMPAVRAVHWSANCCCCRPNVSGLLCVS